MSIPTAATLRAAHALSQTWPILLAREPRIAEIIDRETGLPELLAALDALLGDVLNLGSGSLRLRPSVPTARAIIAKTQGKINDR